MPAKTTKKEKRLKNHATIACLTFLLIIIAAMLVYMNLLRQPKVDCSIYENATISCPYQDFRITEGTATSSIIQQLKDSGLIRSVSAFKLYLSTSARDLVFKAGTYKLSPGMSAKKLVEVIRQGPDKNVFMVTFLPGATITDAKKVLLKAGYSESDVDAAFNKEYTHELLKTKPANSSIEGYIYGDTYEFYKGTSVDKILERTFDEMLKYIKSRNLIVYYKKQGLTLHQGITLASVVQREAKKSDMAQVAQVFTLRLKKNIPLGSDAIIAYRADQLNPNRKKTDTSYLQTITCPWNSRQCTGLPPDAISNPGKEALYAVAHPASGDYLYFLTGDDGKMYYAKTEAEHNANIQKYCHEMCKIL